MLLPAPPRLQTDNGDPTPLYFRLKTLLSRGIESLAHPPGSRLPSERRLAEIYGVSRVTVRQALDGMRREGAVRRARGRRGGTFVAVGRGRLPSPPSGSFESLFSMRHVRRVEILAHDQRLGSEEICAILGLPADSLVTYNERRLVGADGPIAHVRAFMPLAVGARVRRRDLQRRLLQDILLTTSGIKATAMRDEIRACLADSWAAQTLGVRPGYPLLDVRRALLGPGDAPIHYSLILIASERFTMTLEQRLPGSAAP
jgi:GntR family transcriptional regulator